MPLPPPSPAAPPAPLPDGLVEELRREALAIGFSRLGVAALAARDPAVHAAFRAWLERGLGGPMTDWLVGHEALRRQPEGMLPGVRTVVMLATDHAPVAAAAAAPGHGRVAAYGRGDDYHPLLRRRVNRLARGSRRLPGCRTRGVVDSAPFSEREFGWLAGLGWFGKNCMLIDPAAGSCFLLAGLLTDLELPASEPIRVDHCGTCTACLEACPTQAFLAPHLLDAGRCISALTIEQRGAVARPLRAGLGDWIFGCDVCQEVCPWNRRAPGTAEPALLPRGDAGATALVEILALDEAGFRARYRGSAILRASAGLARSAAIALGNHPDAAAAAALTAALDDDEAVVRGAAAWRWAVGSGRGVGEAAVLAAALAARRDREEDDGVRREIDAALAGRP